MLHCSSSICPAPEKKAEIMMPVAHMDGVSVFETPTPFDTRNCRDNFEQNPCIFHLVCSSLEGQQVPDSVFWT